MDLDEHYMGLALNQARLALAAGEVPVGAVLVAGGGEVLAQAYNAPIALDDPTAHAEILVLRRAAARLGNYRLPGTTLYVTIEPCLMCMGALVQARVARLVFGAPDPKAGACVSLYRLPEDQRLNHRIEVLGGIREAECRELLQEFFREPGVEGLMVVSVLRRRYLFLATDYWLLTTVFWRGTEVAVTGPTRNRLGG